MALTKAEKEAVVNEVSELLRTSKMTVVATYQGIDVKSLQQLRRRARENGTRVKVIKNRLVIRALQTNDTFKDVNTLHFNGMLLYAFNDQDEVAAAQVLNAFSKQHPTLTFVGALNSEGYFVEAATVKELAGLPNKNQLLAGLINILNAPMQSVVSSVGDSLNGIMQGLKTKVKTV
jgi:large subunit ribosomal protein L10